MVTHSGIKPYSVGIVPKSRFSCVAFHVSCLWREHESQAWKVVSAPFLRRHPGNYRPPTKKEAFTKSGSEKLRDTPTSGLGGRWDLPEINEGSSFFLFPFKGLKPSRKTNVVLSGVVPFSLLVVRRYTPEAKSVLRGIFWDSKRFGIDTF